MNKSTFKLIAGGCCLLYLLAFLFLPFIALKLVGIGLSGLNCFSVSALAYIPLAAAGSHVLWIAGGRSTEAFRVDDSTKTILELTFTGGENNE